MLKKILKFTCLSLIFSAVSVNASESKIKEKEEKLRVLFINSSISGDKSESKMLTQALLEKIKSENKIKLYEYDLAKKPLKDLTSEELSALNDPESKKNKKILKKSNKAIEKLLKADVIIIGAPMYNFSIPSQLKSYFDNIIRAGKTFNYNKDGSFTGLVSKNPKTFIISTRGGIYSQGPAKSMDFQESYLKTLLNFIGIKDITIIRAEGLGISSNKEKSIKNAKAQINNININK